MKASRQEPPFVPVTLVLETQAEVDALFTLLNHSVISSAVGLDNEEYKALQRLRVVTNTSALHVKLNNAMLSYGNAMLSYGQ